MWRKGAAISISALTCGILSQQLVPDSFYIPAGDQLGPVLAAEQKFFYIYFDISYERIIEVDSLKNEFCIVSYVSLSRSCNVDETA
ncbi:hypothetical protein T05_8028 [Trichinella murrelli]|uniref:Uncharacterized protein n=1 Tax=Trichinella murrelli TaxID=144512 RepID=A0A0V0T1T5_9BILA|nr:hypothetical protein T05_8028 [Trichinella murrelli]